MATMAMSLPYRMKEFEVVEEKVTRVCAGLTFSQKMNQVVQAGFSLVHLTGAFHSAVQEQARLISMLLAPECQDLSEEQFAAVAGKIEKLVDTNERMVTAARCINFRPWKAYLDEMEDQSVHLSGIAESFHMAGDDEALSIFADTVRQISSGHFEDAGTFVGTVCA